MYAMDHGDLCGQSAAGHRSHQSRLWRSRFLFFQNVGTGDVYKYQDPQANVDPQRTDTVHYDAFETIKTYVNVEPRFGARYLLAEGQSLKASTTVWCRTLT